MRVGVVASLDPAKGGIRQYCLAFLAALEDLSELHSFTVSTDVLPPGHEGMEHLAWIVRGRAGGIISSTARKLVGHGRVGLVASRGRALAGGLRSRLGGLGGQPFGHPVDLVIALTPDWTVLGQPAPFVVAVHDLHHRTDPRFPEVSPTRGGRGREDLFSRCIQRARAIIVDSRFAKQQIVGAYEIDDPSRVEVIPFIAPPYLRGGDGAPEVRKRYGLVGDYFFYPSQLWPHKNHESIVRALAVLRERENLHCSVVLTGDLSDETRRTTLQRLHQLASSLGVDEQLVHLGYVPDEAMGGLYEGAVALVIPSFFGPTLIPIAEARRNGCPVIASDLPGVREQTAGGALLIDPNDPEDLAQAMWKVWQSRDHREPPMSASSIEREDADFRRRVSALIEAIGTDVA